MRATRRGMCSGEHKSSQRATKKQTHRAALCACRLPRVSHDLEPLERWPGSTYRDTHGKNRADRHQNRAKTDRSHGFTCANHRPQIKPQSAFPGIAQNAAKFFLLVAAFCVEFALSIASPLCKTSPLRRETLAKSVRQKTQTQPQKMSIDISRIASICNETLPVYLKYERQSSAQPAHIELSEDGVVTAGANPEIGNAVTMDVWHRRTLQWSINPRLTGAQIASAIQDAYTLLERIHAGHTIEWDGSNMSGTLTDDAGDASAALARRLDKLHCEVNVWSADDWLWTAGDLLTVWPEGQTLDDAAASAEPSEPSNVVEDDIRDAIAQEAVSYVSQPRAGLTQWHLSALVADGAIKPDHAAEYAERFLD